MSEHPPPDAPGMYPDAHGAWWYWDGRSWTPAGGWGPAATAQGGQQDQERTQTLLMWVLYLVLGGWIAALVFYLIAGKEKPFLRHHSAEALNLAILMLIPQIVSIGLLIPFYVEIATSDPGDDLTIPATFWFGIGLSVLMSIANYALGITAAVKAHRGQWWRMPIGLHPVRGVLAKGETPPYDVGR